MHKIWPNSTMAWEIAMTLRYKNRTPGRNNTKFNQLLKEWMMFFQKISMNKQIIIKPIKLKL